jgi:hypothetical protein
MVILPCGMKGLARTEAQNPKLKAQKKSQGQSSNRDAGARHALERTALGVWNWELFLSFEL